MVTVQKRSFCGFCLFAKCFQFFGCVGIGVCSSTGYEFFGPLFVNRKTFGLEIRTVFAADIDTFLPGDAQPAQTVLYLSDRAVDFPVLVGIFDA